MRSQTRKAIALELNLLLMLGAVSVPPATGQEPEAPEEITADRLAKVASEMQKEVEILRALKFKHPVKVDFCTEEELRGFIKADRPTEEDGWGKRARSEASMKMVGLIPHDGGPTGAFEEAMTNYVPALYDHHTQTVLLVKRPATEGGIVFDREMLAHELTHALDHQYFDSMFAERSTSDAEFVGRAVFEGSAIVVQTRYDRKVKRSGQSDPVDDLRRMERRMEQGRILFEAPMHALAPFISLFPCGSAFLVSGSAPPSAGSTGPPDVNDAMRIAATHLPRSSEQILHPEKYWQHEKRDEPVVVNDEDVEKLLAFDGLRVVHTDTFGELRCGILTSAEDRMLNPMAMRKPGYWTNTGAAGWGGDRFFLLATKGDKEEVKPKSENLRGLWLTMWDTSKDRDEFIDEYEKHRVLPSRAALGLGRLGVVFFLNFDEVQRETLGKHLQTTPPSFTRDGIPWSFGDAASP